MWKQKFAQHWWGEELDSGFHGTSAQFDLFGSSVNFCSRLEQACPRGCVHVSTDAMSFLLEEEENGGGWEREALELEYKGYDGAIRSTLLRPSMTTS